MPAYKNIRLYVVDESISPVIVMSRRAADMRHKHFETLTFKVLDGREKPSDILSVAVPVNSYYLFEGRDTTGKFLAASPVTCMPDTIDRFEEAAEFVIEHSVSVTYESYVHALQFNEYLLVVKNPEESHYYEGEKH